MAVRRHDGGRRAPNRSSHGYVEAQAPGFMLPGWVDLGADALAAAGRIGAGTAAALKAEARRRVASGEYFGHIAT